MGDEVVWGEERYARGFVESGDAQFMQFLGNEFPCDAPREGVEVVPTVDLERFECGIFVFGFEDLDGKKSGRNEVIAILYAFKCERGQDGRTQKVFWEGGKRGVEDGVDTEFS